MVPVELLKQLSFFQGLDGSTLEKIAESANIQEPESNSLIINQHDRAIALYVLLSGTVQFLIDVEGSGKLLVGLGSEPGLVIGWSVFCPPFRYMSDVRCEAGCRLLRIPHHVIDELLQGDHVDAIMLLRRVAQSLASRLEAEQSKLLEQTLSEAGDSSSLPHSLGETDLPWQAADLASVEVMVDFLAHSSLFDGIEPSLLNWIAHQATVISYAKDDSIFMQDRLADHLYILVDGRVGCTYCKDSGERCIFLRSQEVAGDILGWSALVDPRRYRTAASALETTHLVAIPADTLLKLCEQQPAFGIRIMQRVMQTIRSRLRFIRVRMVARRYHAEVKAMRVLLDQAAETLPVTSPLHKIPYLLENRLTLSDAFHSLELTRAHGEPIERELAELSLEILQGVHRELEFYQGLQKTYEVVVHAPRELPPEAVRRKSMEAFTQVFDPLSWRIQGEEHLPQHGGNIVIMNHLENHMETMLPNEFRLTLDSHFVSSMILYKHYHEAPIRVVRKPELGWFGYQQYFDRLDYIYVYAGEADEEDRDRNLTRDQRNHEFIDRASACLEQGYNLLIAPEGRCSYTEDSPGPFKVGAFRLAVTVKPEPLIIPIAVANFDKRLTHTATAAIVFPPFRLSEQMDDPEDKDALYKFVNQLQDKYREYVTQAIALASAE